MEAMEPGHLPLGVRKGAWTVEEDNLLRKCVERHGEGKWHLVPFRAGLHRCRKSCRLRWLNYLKPNIKKGEFEEDEIDLIMRLHKLLGNRWSLIAGRLPGRTANDIKNYWNSHLRKKAGAYRSKTDGEQKEKAQKPTVMRPNIIRPRPRNFTKALKWANGNSHYMAVNIPSTDDLCKPSTEAAPLPQETEMMWWENLFDDNNKEAENQTPTKHLGSAASASVSDGTSTKTTEKLGIMEEDERQISSGFEDLLGFDVDVWEMGFFSMDQQENEWGKVQ